VNQLESERGDITVDEYAQIEVSADGGTEKQTLAELGLPRGAALRVKRVWMKRIGGSPALAKLVRKALAKARGD
jgi:hypothetical protein